MDGQETPVPHGPISRSPGPRKALWSEMRDAPLRVHSLPASPGRYSDILPQKRSDSNPVPIVL